MSTNTTIFDENDRRANAAPRPAKHKQGTPLSYFLCFISAVFIGILIFAYIVTKKTNPVFLDEHGKPTVAGAAHTH
jgi:hypothetical protein